MPNRENSALTIKLDVIGDGRRCSLIFLTIMNVNNFVQASGMFHSVAYMWNSQSKRTFLKILHRSLHQQRW